MPEQTKTFLLKLWNDQEIQLLVLISLIVQLFLLFTGRLRRRRICGLLRLMIWLAYVGADAVAAFAIGLLSQYEEKYKLRSRQLTKDHTLPFLWAPFLLLHLGGQDTITAFSMEDNNLWRRHLLNLVIQVTLTLYAFWKSFDLLDFQLLVIAVPIFAAGLIKYGERTWALYSGSRGYLSRSYNEEVALGDYNSGSCGDVVASYALNTVLRVRGLFVGRTLFQLGGKTGKKLVVDFKTEQVLQNEGRLRIVMAELGMLYDLLYTKAMVLQSRSGRIFRCIAEASMVVAFVLFLANHQLHAYNRADLIISYTLFGGALFTGACSVSMVTVSPWTMARLKRGNFLHWLSWRARSVLNAIVQQCQTRNVQQQMSIAQFNLTNYSMYQQRRPKLISKGVTALGLEEQERNMFHVDHKDKLVVSAYIESLYSRGEGSQGELELGDALVYALKMPFEHALFRLHLYTDLYVSSLESPTGDEVLVAKECMVLANYLMHLMLNCPHMLPVGIAAQDLEPIFTKWVRDKCRDSDTSHTTMTKQQILKQYTEQVLGNETDSVSPFGSLRQSVASLRTIKEMWARLLIYAAGKCPMEMHARQLSNGVEPITVLSLLMLHHAEGDAGMREVSLFTDPHQVRPTRAEALVSVDEASWRPRPDEPRYAFEFRRHARASLSVAPWAQPQPVLQILPDLRQIRVVVLGRGRREVAPPLADTGRGQGDTSLETARRHMAEYFQIPLRLIELLEDTSSETALGMAVFLQIVASLMEQQETHAALEGEISSETLGRMAEYLEIPLPLRELLEDTSSETARRMAVFLQIVASLMEQQETHAALEDTSPNSDVAAPAPEIARDIDSGGSI